ncbi:MAG: iron complex outermembrane receptor protein, partial [Paracoccaceae bacterium]
DVTNQQFFAALAAIGSTPESYDSTEGSASRTAALAYVAANPSNTITREPNGNITELVSVADNINTNLVEVIDFSASYAFQYSDWGTFNLAANAAYYVGYDYAGLDGVIINAAGRRNADTALAPPLPELVATLRASWNRNNHAASVLTKYTDSVTFDGVFRTGANPPAVIPESYIVNANYIYSFNDVFGTSGAVSVNVNNLFDWEPKRLPVTGGFESRLYDNFGRMFAVTLDVEI